MKLPVVRTDSVAPPCAILDDAELAAEAARPRGGFSGWREDPEKLRAERLFPTQKEGAGAGATGFPSAFQTYKGAGSATTGGFPFQRGPKPATSVASSSWAKIAAAPARPRPVVKPAAPPLQIVTASPELGGAYRYSQCTPPAQEPPPPGYSPKTPPWWDASGNLYGVAPPPLDLAK